MFPLTGACVVLAQPCSSLESLSPCYVHVATYNGQILYKPNKCRYIKMLGVKSDTPHPSVIFI